MTADITRAAELAESLRAMRRNAKNAYVSARPDACHSITMNSTRLGDLSDAADLIERQAAELERLRARLAAPQKWLAEYAKDWHTQGSQYAYTEATDPDASEDWTTEDVVKAFVAGAEIAERDAAATLAANGKAVA